MLILLILITPILFVLGPIGWVLFFLILGAALYTGRVVSGRGE